MQIEPGTAFEFIVFAMSHGAYSADNHLAPPIHIEVMNALVLFFERGTIEYPIGTKIIYIYRV